jgi:hypothetical protein
METSKKKKNVFLSFNACKTHEIDFQNRNENHSAPESVLYVTYGVISKILHSLWGSYYSRELDEYNM